MGCSFAAYSTQSAVKLFFMPRTGIDDLADENKQSMLTWNVYPVLF